MTKSYHFKTNNRNTKFSWCAQEVSFFELDWLCSFVITQIGIKINAFTSTCSQWLWELSKMVHHPVFHTLPKITDDCQCYLNLFYKNDMSPLLPECVAIKFFMSFGQ